MNQKFNLWCDYLRDRFIYALIKRLFPLVYRKIAISRRKIFMNEYIDKENVHSVISQMISSEKPIMIGRLGNTERHIIAEYFLKKNGLINGYSKKWKGWLLSTSGFFIKGEAEEEIDSLVELYISSMKYSDFEGIWDYEFEPYIINKCAQQAKITNVNNMLIYSDEIKSWGISLEGKRVVVISPFERTIRYQYERRELVWNGYDVLPEFSLITVKSPYTAGGNAPIDKSWFEVFGDLCNTIDAIEYDIAIIGCGIYGYPLAAHIKEKGKKAIQMCGETQIIFGILGKRWEDGGYVDKYKNEYWIHPFDDKPSGYQNIEGGCYW